MKKLMARARMGNKGFTLVELIIVIAIIAVLAAVLAPQYIKYVENSKVATDENAASEILHAAQVSIASPTVYDALVSAVTNPATDQATVATVAYADNTTATGTVSGLTSALTDVAGTKVDFKSNTHQTKTYTVTIGYVAASKTFTVTGAWSS